MAGDGQGDPRCQPFCDGRRKGFTAGRRIQKNKKGLLLQTLVLTGGAEGNRTPDLLNAIQALSQLSYNPVMRTDDLIAAYFLNCKQNFCLLLKKGRLLKKRGQLLKMRGDCWRRCRLLKNKRRQRGRKKRNGQSKRGWNRRDEFNAGRTAANGTAANEAGADGADEKGASGEKFFHRRKKDLFFIFLGCKRICVAGV